ncbi:hypothetical protein RFI_22645 [Reticulomyxa filosa]|uniref:Ion transport domain-containing protein n=1 Tax=Reticulomyxa filosa TaxID=46433 RepID=X6MLG0_RETFI|nr:hypothetical protein RFI_22645 [Reticulomyxa filosa]|eukprot:ETO14724.1 hypothetical protein RFI_22645 [Reticulomyxa filosa]
MDLLQTIESDHLLAILCDTPCDIDDLSIFDIALRFRLETFTEFHRINPLLLQMWYQFDYLDPKENFLQIGKDWAYILRRLVLNPPLFYFSTSGQYIITSLLYVFYVLYFSYITVLRIYPYQSYTAYPQELVLWFLNAGYVTYEMLQLVLEGRGYFLDVLNYWDICIVMLWLLLALMRFVLPGLGLTAEEWGTVGNQTSIDARNKMYTIIYTALWGAQCVALWTRTASVLQRLRSTGQLLNTVLKMIVNIMVGIKILYIRICIYVYIYIFFVVVVELNMDGMSSKKQ